MSEGSLQPGATINLGEISRQLGISKTPLRDALIQLESDGFVTIIPRKGVRVNEMSLDDIREAYEAVGLVESYLIAETMDKLTPAHVEHMQSLNQTMKEGLSHDAFSTMYDQNLEFHSIYTELSTNKILKKIMYLTKLRLDDFRRRSQIKEWGLKNCMEHDILLDLIKKQDHKGASRFLQETHWSFDAEKPFFNLFPQINTADYK